MKVFKAALCLALTTFIFFAPAARVAFADVAESKKTYAYADIGTSVYFFSEKNLSSALFIIPQTYCVEVLGKEDGWLHVKYAEDNGVYRAVTGYCRADELITIDKPLKNLYLYRTVTVVYRAEAPSGFLPALSDVEMTAAYYGEYNMGNSTYSYVLCGESFGYIDWQIGEYAFNTLPDEPTVAPVENGGANAKLIVTLVITGVAAAAIAALYFTSKKPKLPQK